MDLLKTRRKSDNNVPVTSIKDIYNPFPDLSYNSSHERQAVKTPKVTKRAWKCFQLVMICQKLLKPFSSTNKATQSDVAKQMSKSSNEIVQINCQSVPITDLKSCKVDTGVQTGTDLSADIFDGYGDHRHDSADFPYDIDESVKEPYWDLDIDSAIVGDFNSTSTLSLNEQLDPHYATIKISMDGRLIEKTPGAGEPIFCSTFYPNENSCFSNCSSPKSGVYSKIIKPKKIDYFNAQVNDYFRLQNGARLNFETIMAIRNQLGLFRDLGDDLPSYDCGIVNNDKLSCLNTPDIPRRNYGSSVIDYITKLRQSDQYQSSCLSQSITNTEKELSSCNVYSPIWMAERRQYDRIAKLSETPLSEPIAPKRSINKLLHQLNQSYRDDSSEDTSSISFTSPLKLKYSYPRTFSDNYSRKPSAMSTKPHYVNLLTDEMNQFRHMDSELDVNVERLVDRRTACNDIVADQWVPLDVVRDGDVHFLCDEKMFLQPLMERSCEEDYFNRDMLSTLDYINV